MVVVLFEVLLEVLNESSSESCSGLILVLILGRPESSLIEAEHQRRMNISTEFLAYLLCFSTNVSSQGPSRVLEIHAASWRNPHLILVAVLSLLPAVAIAAAISFISQNSRTIGQTCSDISRVSVNLS